jgi:CRISPR-associated protein Csd1
MVSRALARARVDTVENRAPNQTRFGLVKAFLIREGDTNVKPYLNEGHPSPAYHCGRLMAVYARLQYAALGDVGAGVVQRFYAAASATPSLVLGRLARLSQFHLNKLEPGLARSFETKIANIWSRIGDRPPGALKLEEQSLFALGYYQQLAADRAEKAAASEAETVKEEENV